MYIQGKTLILGVVYRHLESNGARVPDRNFANYKAVYFVAYYHFNPSILQDDNKGPIPVVDDVTEGRLYFTDSDRLPSDVIENGYYPAPNHTLKKIKLDLEVAERSHMFPVPAIPVGSSNELAVASVPGTNRRSPAEREKERLVLQLVNKPGDVVEDLLSARRQIAELEFENYSLREQNNSLTKNVEKLEGKVKELAELYRKAGLDRVSIFSDEWHEAYPGAAQFLYGFPSWKASRAILTRILFRDMEVERRTDKHLSDFEAVLVTLMVWRVPMKQELVALILDAHQTTVSRCYTTWGPKLARKGRMFSNLDLDATFDFLSAEHCQQYCLEHHSTAAVKDRFDNYIDAAMPREYKAGNLQDVSLLVDGKDIRTDSVQVHSGINILMYSNKVGGSAARFLSWILAGGLNVYNTGLYLGRVSEERLVELHCSLAIFVFRRAKVIAARIR